MQKESDRQAEKNQKPCKASDGRASAAACVDLKGIAGVDKNGVLGMQIVDLEKLILKMNICVRSRYAIMPIPFKAEYRVAIGEPERMLEKKEVRTDALRTAQRNDDTVINGKEKHEEGAAAAKSAKNDAARCGNEIENGGNQAYQYKKNADKLVDRSVLLALKKRSDLPDCRRLALPVFLNGAVAFQLRYAQIKRNKGKREYGKKRIEFDLCHRMISCSSLTLGRI